MGLTLADVILVAGFALLGAYLATSGRASEPGAYVEVRNAAGEISSFKLSEPRTIEVDGREGKTVIAISGGCARFIASPCSHKICMNRGAISCSGEWIACVPNGIVAVVTGKRAYDGITPW
jgi:hypothetical protein